MPCPGSGPCGPWDIDLRCCLDVTGGINGDPCLNSGEPVPQAVVDSSILAASQFMWAATGRQFGCCQVTIRPTQNPKGCDCNDDFGWGFPWYPMHLPDGSWTNISCFCGQDPCGCPEKPCEIALPYPVCSVDQVKIDGNIIGKSLYRVDDFHKLVFTPGVHNEEALLGNAVGPVGGPIVLGGINVVGPGVQVGPAFNGLPAGIDLPLNPGNVYLINLNPALQDVVLEFGVPSGCIGGVFVAMSGGDIQTFEGNGHFFPPGVQNDFGDVTWTNPADANTGSTFFVVNNDSGTNNQIAITVTDGLPQCNLRLIGISWTEAGAGMECFPKCNNLALTDDQPGTMSVTLTYGRPIPELVKLATAKFACELIKACLDLPCMFPQRISSISRQGVTVGFLDPMDFVQQGRTGIYLVDMAIKTYNPKGLLKNASVTSKDYMDKWRVTTWENKFNGREDPFGPNCT